MKRYRAIVWTLNDGFDMRDYDTIEQVLVFVGEAMGWPHFIKAQVTDRSKTVPPADDRESPR
jgi:hypothetical protein